jgi:flagellar hook-associated protein 1 FlgK
VTAGGVAATPRSGALASLLEARNSPTGAVRQAGTDLDTLARALIADVNRVHAGGAGLVGFATLTAAHAVSAPSVPLGAAWLPLAPQSGAFTIVAHDGGGSVVSSVTVSVTAGATTLDDVRAAIDADPNLTASIVGGRLVIGAGAGITFSFAGDTSDTLAALGINTFFSGADAGTIALDPVIAADPTKIAAALADGSGLVHPGDGTNALELARLRSRLVLGAGTETFGGFVASLVSRIGSQARQAAESLDRQETAVHLVEAMRQQTSGVSTDEELISLAQSQNAYAAAARYVTTINDVLETLLRMV